MDEKVEIKESPWLFIVFVLASGFALYWGVSMLLTGVNFKQDVIWWALGFFVLIVLPTFCITLYRVIHLQNRLEIDQEKMRLLGPHPIYRFVTFSTSSVKQANYIKDESGDGVTHVVELEFYSSSHLPKLKYDQLFGYQWITSGPFILHTWESKKKTQLICDTINEFVQKKSA